MKTTLKLSTVLLFLTLAPAAFATDARDHGPAPRAGNPQGTVTVMHVVTTAPDLAAITRSALQGLDVDLRAAVLDSLRESSLRMLQLATPVLEAAGAALGEGHAVTFR